MRNLCFGNTELGVIAATCAVILTLSSGCSGSKQESQVSGHVSLDGKRVGPGTVVFAPVGAGRPATGAVDADGHYSMSTSNESGLGAGKYKAAVSIREPAPDMKRGDRPPPGKLLIPAKYEDSAASGLEYEVETGSNTIDIELRSQAATSAIRRAGLRISYISFKTVQTTSVSTS